MAIFNEIEAQRFARMLQKFFGIKGGAPVRQLAGEIAPAFPLFSGVENRYLENWNRYGVITDAGPTAANQSGGRFRNPANSNAVAVIEKLCISCGATDRLLVQQGQSAADLATVNPTIGNRLDARFGLTSGPQSVISQQATAVALPALTNQFTIWGNLVLANTPIDIITFEDQELTVLPGDAIQVSAVTVNERFLSAIIWRERLLEEPERS